MIIFANLDQEARWSGLGVPAHVARRLAELSPLLRALAPAGEDVSIVTERPARWDLAWADPGAKVVNDRRFALAVARELGCALAGARAIDSLDGVEWPARWVCKAAWSAAGRDRLLGAGAPSGPLRARVASLVARAGGAVVEPWLDRLSAPPDGGVARPDEAGPFERITDFGACGTVDATGAIIAHPPHVLVVNARGGFRGIERRAPELEPHERAELERVFAGAGAALARAGYAGPFGIDGFVYRDPAGRRALHAMCEINARYTFGHVAHALGCAVLGFGAPVPTEARVLVAPVTAWATS
ncbi:MAG TPA: hypothetical protein VMJ10_33105 [Kofleriaceae bacterium]|nr:hypothetical protein [Kofleriaceae bacterium]